MYKQEKGTMKMPDPKKMKTIPSMMLGSGGKNKSKAKPAKMKMKGKKK